MLLYSTLTAFCEVCAPMRSLHRQTSAGVRLEFARRVEGEASYFEVDSIGKILMSVYAGPITSGIEGLHLPIIVKYTTRLSFSKVANSDGFLRIRWKDWERNAAQGGAESIEVHHS